MQRQLSPKKCQRCERANAESRFVLLISSYKLCVSRILYKSETYNKKRIWVEVYEDLQFMMWISLHRLFFRLACTRLKYLGFTGNYTTDRPTVLSKVIFFVKRDCFALSSLPPSGIVILIKINKRSKIL